MRHFTLLLIGILASLWLVGVVLAVPGFDDRGNPNDPRVNERANACYDGGTLAGKCDTQAEWDAGWYLIRFEYGLLGCGDFLAQFSWAKPAVCGSGVALPTAVPSPTLPPR